MLDVKYMVKSNSTTGVHSYGSISGTPSMLLERGGMGLCLTEDVKAYKKDFDKRQRGKNFDYFECASAIVDVQPSAYRIGDVSVSVTADIWLYV